MLMAKKKAKTFISETTAILRFEILSTILCTIACYFVLYFIRKLSEIHYETKLILKCTCSSFYWIQSTCVRMNVRIPLEHLKTGFKGNN